MYVDKPQPSVEGRITAQVQMKNASASNLHALREHFTRKDVVSAATDASMQTYDFILKNKGIYTRYGLLDSSKSWWPGTEDTNNKVVREERRQQFRASCFEFGLIHYLMLLTEVVVPWDGASIEVIYGEDRHQIARKIAFWPSTNIVLRELAKGREAVAAKLMKSDNISLKMLSDLCGYGPETATARVRDAKLLPMARSGILFAHRTGDLGYSIEIGTIGRLFYHNVYFPMLNKMTDIDPNV